MVHLPPVQQACGRALRAGPLLYLSPVRWSWLRHAEGRHGRPGINQGQQVAQTPGVAVGHLEWQRQQAQRHALEDLPAAQMPPRHAGAGQLARHGPQAWFSAQVAGGMNLFRRIACRTVINLQPTLQNFKTDERSRPSMSSMVRPEGSVESFG